MRKMLRKLRGEMTQQQAADRIGVHRRYYSQVELGHRKGNYDFWNKVQKAFRLSDSTVYRMMQEVGNDDHEKPTNENKAD